MIVDVGSYATVIPKGGLLGGLSIVLQRGRINVSLLLAGEGNPHITQVVFQVVLVLWSNRRQRFNFELVQIKNLSGRDRVPGHPGLKGCRTRWDGYNLFDPRLASGAVSQGSTRPAHVSSVGPDQQVHRIGPGPVALGANAITLSRCDSKRTAYGKNAGLDCGAACRDFYVFFTISGVCGQRGI